MSLAAALVLAGSAGVAPGGGAERSGAGNARAGFEAGGAAPSTAHGKPDASDPTEHPPSVGVPPEITLTSLTGDLMITRAGTVVDGMYIAGKIRVLAPDVTIRNSIIRGSGPITTGEGLVQSESTGLRIIDSEIAAAFPTPGVNGVMGSNFTLERVEVHGVIDPVHVHGEGNVVIKDSWLHDSLHYAQDPSWDGGPSHDDSVQITSGTNIVITGSVLEGATGGSAVQITQDHGPVSDVRIERNRIGGGGCSINIAESLGGPVQRVTISDNVFDRDQRHDGCAIIRPDTSAVTNQANIWVDGAPVEVSRG